MMDLLYQIILWIHIIFGTISLVLFWIPVATKKGRQAHRYWGRWYVRAMTLVVSTAAILSLLLLIKADFMRAAFLGFLSVLTGHTLWAGYAILKEKKEQSSSFQSIDLAFSLAMTLFGGLLLYVGLTTAIGSLGLIFGAIGLINGPQGIVRFLTSKSQNWFMTHLNTMLFSGAAAYTAFFAFGASRFIQSLLSGYWMLIPWLAPTLLTFIAVEILKRTVYKKVALG